MNAKTTPQRRNYWPKYRDRHRQVKMGLPGHPDGRVGRVTFVQRSRHLVLRWRQDGCYRHERVGSISDSNILSRALARAREINVQVGRSADSAPAFQPVTVTEVCGMYLAEKNAHPDVSGATLKKYGTLLAHVKAFAATALGQQVQHLHELTTTWCESFAAWLDTVRGTRNGCPPSDANPARLLSPVGKREIKQRLWSVLEYARMHTPPLVPPEFRNPMSRNLVGRKVRRDNGLSEPPVSLKDLVAVVAVLDRYQLGLLAPLFIFGPRPSELGHILRTDLDLGNSILFVRSRPTTGYQTKGRRDKAWPVTDALAACLKPFLGRSSIVLFPKRKYFERQAREPMDFMDEAAIAAEFEKRKGDEVARLGQALTKIEVEAISEGLWAAAGAVDARDVARELERAARTAGLAQVPTPKGIRHLVESQAEASRLSPGVIRHLLGHAPLRGDALINYNHTTREVLREQVALLDTRRIELVEALTRRTTELDVPSTVV